MTPKKLWLFGQNWNLQCQLKGQLLILSRWFWLDFIHSSLLQLSEALFLLLFMNKCAQVRSSSFRQRTKWSQMAATLHSSHNAFQWLQVSKYSSRSLRQPCDSCRIRYECIYPQDCTSVRRQMTRPFLDPVRKDHDSFYQLEHYIRSFEDRRISGMDYLRISSFLRSSLSCQWIFDNSDKASTGLQTQWILLRTNLALERWREWMTGAQTEVQW